MAHSSNPDKPKARTGDLPYKFKARLDNIVNSTQGCPGCTVRLYLKTTKEKMKLKKRKRNKRKKGRLGEIQ